MEVGPLFNDVNQGEPDTIRDDKQERIFGAGINDPNRCPWCGGFHQSFCPRVKAIEYAEDGILIRRVEFFAPNDYPPLVAVQTK